MSPVVKFPDMRPPPRPKIEPLPPLSAYRQIKPTLATKDTSMEITPAMRRARRKKLIIWFSVAVAFHATLLLVFFLTPKMRLIWNPPPEAWVPVVSLPKADSLVSTVSASQKPGADPAATAQVAAPEKPALEKPVPQGRAAQPAKTAKHSAAKPKSSPTTPSAPPAQTAPGTQPRP